VTTDDAPVAVVTGAAGNLGPVWVGGLLETGHRVAALVLAGTESDPALAALGDAHGAALDVVTADVTSRPELEAAADRVAGRWGVPTVLVNNAGIDSPPRPGHGALLEDLPLDTFRQVLEVNLLGAFQAMQVFGARMAAEGRGSIVNVGSLYASVSPDVRMYDHVPMDPPFLKPPAYGASKAGLVNLTRYFATHLAPRGVRVNALSPGGVAGGQDAEFVAKFSARVPLGRLGEPAELVQPLLFLATEASSYVTGINLKVDGGFTAW
jgi:NAD(P)-dependent dehydrogenase (short-subunit alcohol dehydrogenase family)